jgi:4-alpha-glucanotransferase
MPEQVTFILGIHNHQPVGNFEHVIEEAWEKAYRPFMEVMSRYDDIPFSLHCSGILWDWFEAKHPEYIETAAGMTAAGRLEIMSGGYYEPILTVIPGRDRSGQLEMMRSFVADRFGAAPRGCWLTERIWDPHLPETLSRAGLEYVVVDDSHFKSTGFTEDRMRGYFNTEENDFYIRVFPIDKRLRYLIPFHEPEEVIEYLRDVSREPGGGRRVAVLADDGEKFGLWTGTNDLCYRQRWLERFCELLRRNGDWITVSTFSRVIDETPPRGIVYLPTASYSEMMEWALPLRAQESYRAARDVLSASGAVSEPAEALRGGFWRNFLVKYEESNWMHKRMLRASELVGQFERGGADPGAAGEARSHLYQAQCNCAYWHGLFGGLYLPHLRSAVFKHLIAAEEIVRHSGPGNGAGPLVERGDLDGDGVEETVVATASLQAFFKARGGTLRELDLMGPRFNLTDTLTRREEIYHRDLIRLAEGGNSAGSAISIHDVATAKEKGLEKHLQYDRLPRASLVDRFLESGGPLDQFAAAEARELGDFADGLYEISTTSDETATHVVLERTGVVSGADGPVPVRLEKRISIPGRDASMKVRYAIRAEGAALSCRFAVENVLSFLAGNAPDRYFNIPGRTLRGGSHLASTGEEAGVETVRMVDEWLDIAVTVELEPAALLWRFPIETVSNSDAGFERVYQGSAVVPVWDLGIEAGQEAAFSIVFSFGPARD